MPDKAKNLDNAPIRSLLFAAALLFYFTLVHVGGLYLFSKGFLLNRLVLNQTSTFDQLPYEEYDPLKPDGHWHPPTYKKAVILVIDALRDDFLIPQPNSPETFHNVLTVPHDLVCSEPGSSFLARFIADPPTTTLQRLKGLTTGTMPTFIDAGSNFGATDIDEDNLISQLKTLGRRLVFAGDDTWSALFPESFDEMYPFDSFNVPDLWTVDNGVKRHLSAALNNQSQWDVFVGHFLGVDHAGHTFGPSHIQTQLKLEEMNQVIADTVMRLDQDTLLILMGDHGMDDTGNHGGDSELEVNAALWMYSKNRILGSESCNKFSEVLQIDFVPTFALLMGLPIPFNNLGSPILEAFAAQSSSAMNHIARLVASQMQRYTTAYRDISRLDLGDLDNIFSEANNLYRNGAIEENTGAILAYEKYIQYQKAVLSVYRRLWAQYDLRWISLGIVILVLGLVAMSLCANDSQILDSGLHLIAKFLGLSIFVALLSLISCRYIDEDPAWVLAASCLGSLLFVIGRIRSSMSHLRPSSDAVSGIVLTLLHCLLFGSNSFVVWEDSILHYFATTLFLVLSCRSVSRGTNTERVLKCSSCVSIILLIRLSALSSACREEQASSCTPTYFMSDKVPIVGLLSSVLLILSSSLLPFILKQHLLMSSSWHYPISAWVSYVFPAASFLSFVYWLLDMSEAQGWSNFGSLEPFKLTIARVLLFGITVIGTPLYLFSPLSIRAEIFSGHNTRNNNVQEASRHRFNIRGYENVYGSLYLVFLLLCFLLISFLFKPLGTFAMTALFCIMMNRVELQKFVGHSKVTYDTAAMSALLGHLFFYFTGHQATIPSIQWKVAFIPFRTLTYPWSPLLVILNSFGPHIIVALCVPLFSLWRRKVGWRGALQSTFRASGLLMLCYLSITISSVIFAAYFRRHLMVWKIFAPRFMTAALTLLVVDLTIVFGVFVVGLPKVLLHVSSIFETQ